MIAFHNSANRFQILVKNSAVTSHLAFSRGRVTHSAAHVAVLFATRGRQPARLLCPRDSPGKNSGAGCHFLREDLKKQGTRGEKADAKGHLLHVTPSYKKCPKRGWGIHVHRWLIHVNVWQKNHYSTVKSLASN